MRFKKFLLTEITMTVDQALGALGLTSSDIGNMTKIRKAFRDMSKRFHPDVGGSKEQMQQIVAAWETLKRKGAGTSKATKEEHREKWKQTGLSMRQMMLHAFKPDMFIRHFNKFVDDKLRFEMKSIRPDEKDRYPDYAGFTVEFFNNDRSIVFEMNVTAMIANAYNEKSLGFGTIRFPLSIVATGFFNNRKQKLSKSDWKFTSDHSFFKQPEKIFPDKKLKAIFSGKTSGRKFQKRDMITYLTKKLHASWDGTYASIPLIDDYKFVVFRQVFMRSPAWMGNGIYKRFNRIAQAVTVTFPEDVSTAEFFADIQKEVKRRKPKNDEATIKIVNSMLQKYKDSRKR